MSWETVSITPVKESDIDGLMDLINIMPLSYWMTKISRGGLRKYLQYSRQSPLSVMLAARQGGGGGIAGYIFAVFDIKGFFRGFALRHPFVMASIMYHQFRRSRSRKIEPPPPFPELPAFSWSSAGRENARVMGIHVPGQSREGADVATALYLKLFDSLKERGCRLVEEYMRPDDTLFAGKYPEPCGWRPQRLDDGGYKLTKEL